MINCLTQKDAALKRCCGPAGISTSGGCIGVGCMAWRWQTAIFNPETNQWWQPGDTVKIDKVETRVTDVGYCGLAGLPAP